MKFFVFIFLFSCATSTNNKESNEDLFVHNTNSPERNISSSAFDPENLASDNVAFKSNSNLSSSWNAVLTYDLSKFSFKKGTYGLWFNTAGPATPPKITDLRAKIICSEDNQCRQSFSNVFVAIEKNTLLSLDPSRVLITSIDFKKKSLTATFSRALKEYFLATSPNKSFSMSLRFFSIPENKITQRQVASITRPLSVVFFAAQPFTVPNLLTPIQEKKR